VNDTSWLVLIGIVVVGVAALFLFGGEPDPVDPVGPVLPPIVDAGSDRVVNECTGIRVGCEGYDPAGGAVSYQWTAPRGSFDNARVLHPVYTAPATCGFGEVVVLTLTITNEHGVSAHDNLDMHICDTIPCAYLAICPTSSPCTPTTRSSLPAVCRPHALPKPAPVCVPVVPYCSPVPPCPPQPAPLCVPVVPYCPPVPPCPPISPCIDVSSAKSVNEGKSIQLFGTVCDPDNNIVSYRWTADKGTFDDPTSLNPIYYAPMTNACGGEYACITLTAIDSCCARGVDQILLRITNVNHLPIADAGGDITIHECSSVRLTCSGYDPDCDALSYYWTASCGRGSFDNPYVLHPIYTAPPTNHCGDEEIVLTLTVTDTCGASATDSITVYVRNGNTPPRVNADP
jgi:hypothetical protein